jgi:hypothetical protein
MHIAKPGAEGSRQQGDAIACVRLGEDRFEVILDRVLGQRHLAGQGAGVAADRKQAE